MSINSEKQKIKEVRMFNKLDARDGRLSDSVMDIYEKSLEQNVRKVKKKW